MRATIAHRRGVRSHAHTHCESHTHTDTLASCRVRLMHAHFTHESGRSLRARETSRRDLESGSRVRPGCWAGNSSSSRNQSRGRWPTVQSYSRGLPARRPMHPVDAPVRTHSLKSPAAEPEGLRPYRRAPSACSPAIRRPACRHPPKAAASSTGSLATEPPVHRHKLVESTASWATDRSLNVVGDPKRQPRRVIPRQGTRAAAQHEAIAVGPYATRQLDHRSDENP